MNSGKVNEAELFFETGGPSYRIFNQIVKNWHMGKSIRPRIVGFLLITWVPLLLLALFERRALGATPKESFLLDFGTYARCFLAIPLLVIAEIMIGPRLRSAGLSFIHGGYVRTEDYPALDRAIASVVKWRESYLAEIIILIVAFAGAWFFTTETLTGGEIASWRAVTKQGASGYSLTGLWYHFVTVPLIQFFWYRWLYRLFIWSKFLWTVSRFNLNLVATHADQAGGLGFLGTAHTSFGILSFALSCILSGEVAFLLVFENAQIESFKVEFIVLLVVQLILFLGPLLVFSPVLIRTRLAWLGQYSLLVANYNRAFHEKWIEGKASPNDQLLGSADIQSLADLGSSFDYVRSMKTIPFSLRVMTQLVIMTSIPCVPLLLLVFPINKLLNLLAGAVF